MDDKLRDELIKATARGMVVLLESIRRPGNFNANTALADLKAALRQLNGE